MFLQIWKYEGSKTLSYYLKRRDCIPSIAADMGIPEDAVVPTVMKQILENLQVSVPYPVDHPFHPQCPKTCCCALLLHGS